MLLLGFFGIGVVVRGARPQGRCRVIRTLLIEHKTGGHCAAVFVCRTNDRFWRKAGIGLTGGNGRF